MTRLDPQRPRLRPLTTARRPAAQGPLSATVRWLAALGLCSALGCSATEAPQITTIDGARFLALRCVSQTDDGLTGLPLAGCGCTEAVGTGTDRTLRALGRVECACESLRVTATSRQLVSVNQVKASCTPVTDAAGCVTDWADCQQSPGRGVGGDWIPGDQAEAPVRFVDGVFLDGADCQTPPPRPLVPCEAAGVGQLRGYVGSAGDGRVTVLDLTAGEADDSDVDPKRVLDVDRSIPGITAVFVDDLITDVVAHPFGDFIATVNSTTGSLSLILDEGDVVPALRVELGVAPLLDAVSWPRIDAPLPAYDQTPRAWIAAPTEGLVLPIDLSRLADPMATGVLGAPIAVPGRDGSPGSPARLALSPDGALLFVGHAREPLISVVQLDAPSGFGQVVGTIELPGAACADGYLVRTLTAAEDNSCANGLDDDGDGVIDAEDPDCLDAAGSESPVPGCPKRAECADGADNDGDGLIDADEAETMSPTDAYNLIFAPGFSTRQEANSVSGRGVGMDVVKTNIAKLSGMIDVHTEVGRGTRFAITLPVTLAIIQALVIESAGHTFCIPLNAVLESIMAERAEVGTIEGQEVITLRGRTLPLLQLSRLFGLKAPPGYNPDPNRIYVVVIGLAQHRVGLVVDELLGQQDVVIKPLGRAIRNVPGIAGATELGANRTVLLLDVGRLVDEGVRELSSAVFGGEHGR